MLMRSWPVLLMALLAWHSDGDVDSAIELSAKDIAEKNFYVTKILNLHTESTMTLINDKGQKRIRKMAGVSTVQPNGMDTKMMIHFLYPGDVNGTAYLQIQKHDGEDDMWIYLPALKKVRRLVANNKKDSFVGSDISYGDLLLPTVETFRHTLVKMENLDGEACWVVESVPATEQIKKDYGYGRRVSWIRKSNYMEKRVEYFDTALRPLKVQVVPEVKEVDAVNHKWWAIRREILNQQTGHSTILVMDNVDASAPVGDNFFTPRYLERGK